MQERKKKCYIKNQKEYLTISCKTAFQYWMVGDEPLGSPALPLHQHETQENVPKSPFLLKTS